MMYPYAEFLIDFYRKHAGMTHQNCPENTRAAVIIETRPHFFLPKVIRNVMFFLGPQWNLHILCGEHSYSYIQRFLPGWDVRIIRIPTVACHLPEASYNQIMTSPGFWGLFSESKLLVFQSDSLLSGANVEDFLRYDYIGAPCGRFDEQYIANGGLSLRTRRVMLDCLSRRRPQPGVPEDVFFTQAVREIGAAMPDLPTAVRFSVESLYTTHPFGVHGTDKYFHSTDVAEKITRAISY
jgi:hypothetical protein